MQTHQASKYNFWAEASPSEHLLFNGSSGALCRLDETEKRAVLAALDGDRHGVERRMWDALIAGRFILPADVDEVGELRYRAGLERAHPGALDLDICPTYECNFRCRYCYVEFQDGRMNRETEERVCSHVVRQIPRYSVARVFWHGGEPLLCSETVVRLSTEFSKHAAQNGCQLAITVLTNGYLLDLETARTLWNAGVRYLHITIDGNARTHDRLRPLADGSPTRAHILHNVFEAMQALPELRVNLRINIRQSNAKAVPELLDEIPPRLRERVQVQVSPIHGPQSWCASNDGAFNRSTSLVQLLMAAAIKRGYRVADSQMASRRFNHCTAVWPNNFQIGPDGTLYKCSPWGKPEARVGYLDESGNPVLGEAFNRWHSVADLSERCRECQYLCFCGGGCRLAQLRGCASENCTAPYAQLEQMIINRYQKHRLTHGEAVA